MIFLSAGLKYHDITVRIRSNNEGNISLMESPDAICENTAPDNIGLPAGHIPTALLFFSVGVESGHFMFIGAVLALIALVRRINVPVPRWGPLVPPYAIGGIAMFWVIQRIAAF